MKVLTKKLPKLLTVDNRKTVKGEVLGYKTYILYMAPAIQNDKGINLCSHATQGCLDACLFKSGNGGMFPKVARARINKSNRYVNDRVLFLNTLVKEIKIAIIEAGNDYKIAIRLNGTTDIRFEKFNIFDNNTKNIFEIFPDIQFYDYTKNYLRFDRVLPNNYHLTFSRNEENEAKAFEIINKGYNASFVFDVIPTTYKGIEVVNGDETDLRFLDKSNVIVGLKYKNITGKGANNKASFESGFAIRTI